jgi:hypothetical protein
MENLRLDNSGNWTGKGALTLIRPATTQPLDPPPMTR